MLDNNQHIKLAARAYQRRPIRQLFRIERRLGPLSRERFWGTPLPVWVCQQTGKMEAVANYEELLKKPASRERKFGIRQRKQTRTWPTILKFTKPYIDEVIYDSPFAPRARTCAASRKSSTAGTTAAPLPFAQWGYQGEFAEPFHSGRGQGEGQAVVNKQSAVNAEETIDKETLF